MISYIALFLILVSAVTHASWNYLLKGIAEHKLAAYWWSMVFAGLLFLPFFISEVSSQALVNINWGVVIFSGALKALYVGMLSDVYHRGDLSLGYPIVRSSHLFIPLLAFFFLGETIGVLSWVGMLLLSFGLFFLHLSGWGRDKLKEAAGSMKNTTTLLAVGTAFIIAVYSILDKIGVTGTSAMLYMYLMFLVTLVVLTPFVLVKTTWSTLFGFLKRGILPISGISLFDWGGYLLVLFAMQLTEVSRVVAIRQSSVVFGVLLGSFFLKEPCGRQRITGSVIIFVAIVLVSLS